MASLAIAALPVQIAAPILLAATSKSPTRATTTEVWGDDLLRLPLIDVAFFIRHCPDLSNLGCGEPVQPRNGWAVDCGHFQRRRRSGCRSVPVQCRSGGQAGRSVGRHYRGGL